MVDYNIGIPQQQLYQAPDLMQNAMRMQQMQTNALAMQEVMRKRQEESALRGITAAPSSPEYVQQLARISPELGMKALNMQRQNTLLDMQTRAAGLTAAKTGQDMRIGGMDLLKKHTDLLPGIIASAEPAQAWATWRASLAKDAGEDPVNVPASYPGAERARAIMDRASEFLTRNKPERATIGGVETEYVPGSGIGREIGVAPFNTNAGVPSYPMRPAAADMAQRGQRYAPELMGGAAPANAMAPAAASSPYGGLNAMAAPQDGAVVPASQFAQQQKDAEAQRQLVKVGRETLERERAQAAVKTEERQREENLAKQKVTGTLKGIVDAYKGLASRGELIRASGDQSLTERAGIGVKAAIPSALTTVISPKTGADIATIENLRRDLIPTITALTGAKSIDAVAELTSVLNSLSSPGQTDTAIVKTLNNFGEKYGLGMLLSVEDLAPAKPEKTNEVPAGRKAAAPASNLSAMDQQALDWAKSNPNDPRASAIKDRLGVR